MLLRLLRLLLLLLFVVAAASAAAAVVIVVVVVVHLFVSSMINSGDTPFWLETLDLLLTLPWLLLW